jgi:hypothetical protein
LNIKCGLGGNYITDINGLSTIVFDSDNVILHQPTYFLEAAGGTGGNTVKGGDGQYGGGGAGVIPPGSGYTTTINGGLPSASTGGSGGGQLGGAGGNNGISPVGAVSFGAGGGAQGPGSRFAPGGRGGDTFHTETGSGDITGGDGIFGSGGGGAGALINCEGEIVGTAGNGGLGYVILVWE